jgi:hypothetical protein
VCCKTDAGSSARREARKREGRRGRRSERREKAAPGGEEGQEERGEGEGCTMVGSSFGIGSSSTVTMSPGMTRVLKSFSRR